VNKLLVDADDNGMPLAVINDRTNAVLKQDWQEKYTRSLVDALTAVEREYTVPTGWRAVLRGGVGALANYLPETVLLGSIIVLLWQWFVGGTLPTLAHMLMPLYVLIATLVILHLLISVVFPVRWSAIRERFCERLTLNLNQEYEQSYSIIPQSIAESVAGEREQVEALAEQTREVTKWLATRESSAHVSELYGTPAR
jgi:hypothetical protein